MKTTKEAILKTALEIFSKQGYEGTALSDISNRLNITKAALYKHYPSKEGIYMAIGEYVMHHYLDHLNQLSQTPMPQNWAQFRNLTCNQIIFTLEDEVICQARRLLIMEQFRSEEMADLATKHFRTQLEDRYGATFAHMMELGVMRKVDPAMAALQFTAPITILIHQCDREPKKKAEIIKEIEAFILQFSKDNAVNP